jgi:hypothetical protein
MKVHGVRSPQISVPPARIDTILDRAGRAD